MLFSKIVPLDVAKINSQENLITKTVADRNTPNDTTNSKRDCIRIVPIESPEKSKSDGNTSNSSIDLSEKSAVLEEMSVNETDKVRLVTQHPIVRKILFSKSKCQEYTFVSVDKDNENFAEVSIKAHLPAVKNSALWRMIKLNSDFSVLCIENSGYRIKYSDLQKVLQMADDKMMTVAIKMEHISNRLHKDFAIYASPNCPNTVFVGPYVQTEKHDVVLLRYLNRELIPTNIFNRMKGLPETTIGVWLKQHISSGGRNFQTIDLTESDQEDSDRPLVTLQDLIRYENEATNYYSGHSTYHEVDLSTLDFQSSSGVYFSTNIPQMGYVMGNRVGQQGVILKYPSFPTGLQFKNKNHAIKFLIREFMSSFIAPKGFKLEINVKTSVSQLEKVFDKDLLKHYYIITHKGLLNVLELTPAILKDLKMTGSQLKAAIAARASKMVYDQCLDTMIHLLKAPYARYRRSTDALLEALTSEIEKLKIQEEYQMKELTDLGEEKLKHLNHFKKHNLKLVSSSTHPFKTKMEEVLKTHKIPLNEFCTNQAEIICIDVDASAPKSPQKPTLPIYTKNPDMIITTASPSDSEKDTKIKLKSLSSLTGKDVTNNKKDRIKKDDTIKRDDKTKQDDKTKNDVTIRKDYKTNKDDTNKKDDIIKKGDTIKKDDSIKKHDKIVKKDDKIKNDDKMKTDDKIKKDDKIYKIDNKDLNFIVNTPKGRIIQIPAEQYKRLTEQKRKSEENHQGPALKLPRFDPLIPILSQTELKTLPILDSIPPRLVKLTKLTKPIQKNGMKGNDN